MADDQDGCWPEYSILFRELGVHPCGEARGRSYYEDELEEQLERLGIGVVVGGGAMLDGSRCDIHVAVSDAEAGLRVIREVLKRLGAPASTRIRGDEGEYAVYE